MLPLFERTGRFDDRVSELAQESGLSLAVVVGLPAFGLFQVLSLLFICVLYCDLLGGVPFVVFLLLLSLSAGPGQFFPVTLSSLGWAFSIASCHGTVIVADLEQAQALSRL